MLGAGGWHAQGRAGKASTDGCPGLRLAEGGQVSPSPAPHGPGLGHLVSGATQQLYKDRVALVAAVCVYFLSLYGTSLPSRHLDT